jgi:hypothetical protein
VLLFLIDVVLFTVAALATWYLLVRAGAQRRLAEWQTQKVLATAGIEAGGNLLGDSEAHSRDGVIVAVRNGTLLQRPGESALTADLCLARVAVPLADQIVCKTDEADRIMGPLPAAPRIHTGHAAFDGAYAVFVGSSGGRTAGSYRAAIVEGDTPWAQAPVLDGLLDLGLRWMRIHDGTAELVFPRLAIEDVVRAMMVAHAVERATHGKPLPPIERGPKGPGSGMAGDVGRAWLAGLLPAVVATGVCGGVRHPEGGVLMWCLATLGFLALVWRRHLRPS